ncbi:MAG: C4-dicarboxylate transporter DctA [Pseudomonadota bacterium]|nr:C4-dicarboxylate transporter DctA [Pseudomonadota bacterium]MDE3038143.1 C4-dicarboxylate transporter DctA [Pseudomonadota bacterium]
MNAAAIASTPVRRAFYKNQTFHVLAAIVLGFLLGHFYPKAAVEMKPLGDAFIKMIKMVIGPIIFLTIVTGVSHVGDIKKVGKIGGKALIYFEIITTFSLIIGMVAMNVFRPGDGFDTEHVVKGDISHYVEASKSVHSPVDFIMSIIPDNIIGAFASGDLLQVLFIAVIFGIALSAMGEKGAAINASLVKYSHLIFQVMGIIMKFAAMGAFGAMAFTIGKFGDAATIPLAKLLLLSCASMVLFIFVVLGAVAYYYKFSIWKFVRYLEDEIVIVLGTGSSEAVLPRMMQKMQEFGCSQPVVGLVIPTGYSFNLAGSSMYLAMCVIFIAQAYHVNMSLSQQITILGILLLTSKGAAGVVGSAFIVLAATISATGFLPIEGLSLLLGIDRFMSSVRAMINLIGNGVATVIIAKTENDFDEAKALAEYRAYFEDKSINHI